MPKKRAGMSKNKAKAPGYKKKRVGKTKTKTPVGRGLAGRAYEALKGRKKQLDKY